MLDCLAIKLENIDMDYKKSVKNCCNFSIQLKECTEKIMQLAKVVLCTYEIVRFTAVKEQTKCCSFICTQILRNIVDLSFRER